MENEGCFVISSVKRHCPPTQNCFLSLVMFAALLFLQSGTMAMLNKHIVSKLLLMLLAMFQISFLPHCPAEKLATTLLPNHIGTCCQTQSCGTLHQCIHFAYMCTCILCLQTTWWCANTGSWMSLQIWSACQ